MRHIVLAALFIVFSIEDADARKRRHYRNPQHFIVMPYDTRPAAQAPRHLRTREVRAGMPIAALVPLGWQLQPPDPTWQGKRYISPDGDSWFAVYKVPAERPVSEHMKTIAFAADDETLTYIHGERGWIVASGMKSSRIFYRKAVLACAGRVWHHIAFEYPVDMKQVMDRTVTLASQALIHSQTECTEAVSERQQ